MSDAALWLSRPSRQQWQWSGPEPQTHVQLKAAVAVLRQLFDVTEVLVHTAAWDEWGQPTETHWTLQSGDQLDLTGACEVQAPAFLRIRIAAAGLTVPGVLFIQDADMQFRNARLAQAPPLDGMPTAWLDPGTPTGRGFWLSVLELGVVTVSVSSAMGAEDAGRQMPDATAWGAANRRLRAWAESRLSDLGFVRQEST